MLREQLRRITEQAGQALLARAWRIVTAESCTGGLIAAQLTEIGGSSAWFERGFVTYSNEAKLELLGVAERLIDVHGAVSEPVALAMAEGALRRSRADVAVSVTGIAGPGGGSVEKPVGAVWFGFAQRDRSTETALQRFDGDRADIRVQAAIFALERVARWAVEPPANLA